MLVGTQKEQGAARWVSATAMIGWVVTAVVLLYGSFALFCAFKYQINDHGIYTNFLWNSAHGAPFRYLIDDNYLGVHLSYTLLLVAPLFHVWDHPFLLSVVQWSMGLAGSLLTGWLARRMGLRAPLPAVLSLFFLAYPFTQAVLLCDFHGVCLYYVLFPALYGCLLFRKGWAWIPLVLIAGLREEAALLVVPLLLWFAVRERWRLGWVLSGLAIGYAVMAMTVLFPWINGEHLHASRSNYVGVEAVASTFSASGLVSRGLALVWFFLPAAVVVRGRGWWAVAAIPSVALLIPMCSGVSRINSLEVMYSAAPFTLLVLALLEVFRSRLHTTPPASSDRIAWWLASATVFAVLLIDRIGPAEHGVRMPRRWDIDLNGRAALRAADLIPRDGILLTTRSLAGMAGNRRDLMVLREGVTPEMFEAVRYVFAENMALESGVLRLMIAQLETGAFGVVYSDNHASLLERGAATGRNSEVSSMLALQGRRLAFCALRAPAGVDVEMSERGRVRHWPGGGEGAPAIAKHSDVFLLPKGRYRIRALVQVGSGAGDAGYLSLYLGVASQEVGRIEFTRPTEGFQWLEVPIEMPRDSWVGLVARAGRQPLWLDRMQVVALD